MYKKIDHMKNIMIIGIIILIAMMPLVSADTEQIEVRYTVTSDDEKIDVFMAASSEFNIAKSDFEKAIRDVVSNQSQSELITMGNVDNFNEEVGKKIGFYSKIPADATDASLKKIIYTVDGVQYTFTVIADEKEDNENDEEGSVIFLIIALVVIVFIIIILIVLAMKSKGVDEIDDFLDDDLREYECPSCGAIVTSDMDKCPECGESFDEEEFRCPECMEMVEKDATICVSCGSEFSEPVKEESNE